MQITASSMSTTLCNQIDAAEDKAAKTFTHPHLNASQLCICQILHDWRHSGQGHNLPDSPAGDTLAAADSPAGGSPVAGSPADTLAVGSLDQTAAHHNTLDCHSTLGSGSVGDDDQSQICKP